MTYGAFPPVCVSEGFWKPRLVCMEHGLLGPSSYKKGRLSGGPSRCWEEESVFRKSRCTAAAPQM